MRHTGHIRRFIHAEQGIAAVEFALVLPFLVLLFLGGFEVNRYILMHQKVEKVAYTLADVVAQSTSITTAQLNQVYTAAEQIMLPYSFGADGVVIVSSIYKSGTSSPVIRWSYRGGGTLDRSSMIGTVNGVATLPPGLILNDKDNIIISEVFYVYRPVLTGTLIGVTDIYKTALFKPRLGALLTAPN